MESRPAHTLGNCGLGEGSGFLVVLEIETCEIDGTYANRLNSRESCRGRNCDLEGLGYSVCFGRTDGRRLWRCDDTATCLTS